MTAITSLAAMRRAVATPGVTIRVLAHWQPELAGTTRTPTKAQTNGYFFDGAARGTGTIIRMWCAYPKAPELRFNPDGSVTFYPDTPKAWTLAFDVPEGATT